MSLCLSSCAPVRCCTGLDAPVLQVPAYAAKGGHHKGGANVGLRAYGIAQILPPKAPGKAGTKKGAGGTSSATVCTLPL